MMEFVLWTMVGVKLGMGAWYWICLVIYAVCSFLDGYREG